MADTPETEQPVRTEGEAGQAVVEAAPAVAEAAPVVTKAPATERPERAERKPQGDRPQGDRPQGGRGPQGPGREGGGQGQRREGGGPGNREGRGGPHSGREGGRGERSDDRRDDRRGGGDRDRGRFDGPPEIDIEKLISDPLYLDNQAHGVVSRMRDMDSGTKSQLRRLYNAVRRAVRAPENERQQQFVMLRARLAYTIARHSLRSLDSLEKLLLQVTRKNDARGYERFRDLFEAIVAYNE
jgi:CRISPR type III-A-associated protein Csm2